MHFKSVCFIDECENVRFEPLYLKYCMCKEGDHPISALRPGFVRPAPCCQVLYALPFDWHALMLPALVTSTTFPVWLPTSEVMV